MTQIRTWKTNIKINNWGIWQNIYSEKCTVCHIKTWLALTRSTFRLFLFHLAFLKYAIWLGIYCNTKNQLRSISQTVFCIFYVLISPYTCRCERCRGSSIWNSIYAFRNVIKFTQRHCASDFTTKIFERWAMSYDLRRR